MTGPGKGEAVTTVYLIRHGRTGLNAQGWLRGRSDPPLDEVGRVEADRLAVREIDDGVARLLANDRLDIAHGQPL